MKLCYVNKWLFSYIAGSHANEQIHCCCTASTEPTSIVPGVAATLPCTSASENQTETLNSSEFKI